MKEYKEIARFTANFRAKIGWIARLPTVPMASDITPAIAPGRLAIPVEKRYLRVMTEDERNTMRAEFLREAAAGIIGQPWHWFSYHMCFLPPHPLVRSIVEACIDCEAKLPGLGRQLIRDIGLIGGIDHHEPHYDQLMQKLAEILVLRQLLALPWPEGTTFEHEPAVSADGKRPELKVDTPGQTYLFEVKAPSLLAHQRQRGANDVQAPVRVFPRELLDRVAGEGGLTLPRDNPVKDFLIDTEAKFAPFKAGGPVIAVLVIVWDDFIYEPITVLTQERCGLLTDNSYHQTEGGQAVTFPSIDAVVLVRHLMYFKMAAADEPLLERGHALDFGDDGALPNVVIPAPGGQQLPAFIQKGLRALPLDDPMLARAAEYRPVEMVFWTNIDRSKDEEPALPAG